MEYLQEYEEWESAEEEALIEELISDWKFFVLTPDLAGAILALNDELGSEYFNAEYEKLDAPDGEDSDSEELIENDSWFRERLQRIARVLLGMAFEFQRWFIDEHRGVFPTTWGTIYSVDRKSTSGDNYENTLIMEPDVKPHEAFVVANDTASIRSEEMLRETIRRT